jgi:hypothetical protein
MSFNKILLRTKQDAAVAALFNLFSYDTKIRYVPPIAHLREQYGRFYTYDADSPVNIIDVDAYYWLASIIGARVPPLSPANNKYRRKHPYP